MNGIRFFALRMALTRLASWLTGRFCALVWIGSDDYKAEAFIVGSEEAKRLVRNTLNVYSVQVQLRQKYGADAVGPLSVDLVPSPETANIEGQKVNWGQVEGCPQCEAYAQQLEASQKAPSGVSS